MTFVQLRKAVAAMFRERDREPAEGESFGELSSDGKRYRFQPRWKGRQVSFCLTSEREMLLLKEQFGQIKCAWEKRMLTDDEADAKVSALVRRYEPVKGTTVADIWPDFLQTVKPRSRAVASACGTNRILPGLGALTIPQLNAGTMASWYATMLQGCAENTAANSYAFVAQIVRRTPHFTGRYPWHPWHPPKPKLVKPREAARCIEDLIQLLRAARIVDEEHSCSGGTRTDYATIILVMGLTGLRQAEVAGLSWEDLTDLGGACPTLTVRFQAPQRWQKEQKDPGRPRFDLKSERALPHRLHPDCERALMMHRDKLRRLGVYRPDGPVFPNPRGGGFRTSGKVIKPEAFRCIVERAGLPNVKAWAPHSMRHSMVTLEALAVGEKAAMERSGHKSRDAFEGYLHRAQRTGLMESGMPKLPQELISPSIRAEGEEVSTVPRLTPPPPPSDIRPWAMPPTPLADITDATALRALAQENRVQGNKRALRAGKKKAEKVVFAELCKEWRRLGREPEDIPPEIRDEAQHRYVATYNRAYRAWVEKDVAWPVIITLSQEDAKIRARSMAQQARGRFIGSWVAAYRRHLGMAPK